jgi:hypothetical protein
MPTCDNCAQPLREGARFCPACGAVAVALEVITPKNLSTAQSPLPLPATSGPGNTGNQTNVLSTPLEDIREGHELRPPAPRNRKLLVGVATVVVLGAIAGGALALTAHGPARRPIGAATAATSPTATNPSPSTASTATPSANSTPVPAASARAVGTKVDELIQRSGAARKLLTKGVSDAAGCSANGAGEISDALQQRQSLLNQLEALDVTVLPQGAQVKAALAQSMELSIAADQFFLSWAQEPAVAGCTGTAVRDSVFLEADAASRQTTAAKQHFVALWNPVARHLGLPARAEPDL